MQSQRLFQCLGSAASAANTGAVDQACGDINTPTDCTSLEKTWDFFQTSWLGDRRQAGTAFCFLLK